MESMTVVSVRTNTNRLSVSYTSCARACSEIKTKEKADLAVSNVGSMATVCLEHSEIKTKEKADLITSVGCRLHGDRLL